MKRRVWRPLCCESCREPLETWKTPLEPGNYIACFPCGRLYVVEPDDHLTPVLLSLEAPELRRVFEDVLAVYWARCITHPVAGAAGGSSERKAA